MTIPIHVLVMKARMWDQNGLIKLRILGSSLHNYVHLCSRQMQQESSHICMKRLCIQKEKQFTLATQPYVKISNFTQQHAI
jgi:hypothetical protein